MKWLRGGEHMNMDFRKQRSAMVDEQIRARGIIDKGVLNAMDRVPRHEFVPPGYRELSYSDGPLPIGNGQTISQPYVVAAMTAALQLKPGDRVLEIGTGSGYQTAILAEMGMEVCTMEYIPELSATSRGLLGTMGYSTIHFQIGDGHSGWPEWAPFDGIIVTAAPAGFPEELPLQLKEDGRMVIPIGSHNQDLRVYFTGAGDGLSYESLFPVRFVPMILSSQENSDEI